MFDAAEAMEPGAPLIHEEKENNIALTIDVVRGDIDAAFKDSDLVVEDTFESVPQWHSAIETIGSVADYSANGKYTVYMNTQTLFMARMRLATALGVREADVRVIQTAVGGGFGGKSCDDNNAMVAAILARKARRPVKIINTREEEFLAGSRPRVNMKVWVRMGFKKDGRIRAKHMRIIADNGAYSGKAPAITGVAALRHDTCYKYSDVRSEAYLVYTNKIPTGAFRGFGNPSAEFSVEQMMDIAADELGMDPFEMARLNAAEEGYVSPHGNRVISCELQPVHRPHRAHDRLEGEARQPQAQPRPGHGLHRARERQAPLRRLRRQLGHHQDERGRQGLHPERRGRDRPGALDRHVPDRRGGAGRPLLRRGHLRGRHRPHHLLPRQLRQPAHLRGRQRGEERRHRGQGDPARDRRGDARGGPRGPGVAGRLHLRQGRGTALHQRGRRGARAAVPARRRARWWRRAASTPTR